MMWAAVTWFGIIAVFWLAHDIEKRIRTRRLMRELRRMQYER